MSDQKLHRLVLSALFAALCTVMTLVIQVPSPVQGYVNLGDCAVLLAAWALGPLYGGAAAGTGSMLADLLSGYPKQVGMQSAIRYLSPQVLLCDELYRPQEVEAVEAVSNPQENII